MFKSIPSYCPALLQARPIDALHHTSIIICTCIVCSVWVCLHVCACGCVLAGRCVCLLCVCFLCDGPSQRLSTPSMVSCSHQTQQKTEQAAATSAGTGRSCSYQITTYQLLAQPRPVQHRGTSLFLEVSLIERCPHFCIQNVHNPNVRDSKSWFLFERGLISEVPLCSSWDVCVVDMYWE